MKKILALFGIVTVIAELTCSCRANVVSGLADMAFYRLTAGPQAA